MFQINRLNEIIIRKIGGLKMTNERAKELLIETIREFMENDEVCKYKSCSECGFNAICREIVDYVDELD